MTNAIWNSQQLQLITKDIDDLWHGCTSVAEFASWPAQPLASVSSRQRVALPATVPLLPRRSSSPCDMYDGSAKSRGLASYKTPSPRRQSESSSAGAGAGASTISASSSVSRFDVDRVDERRRRDDHACNTITPSTSASATVSPNGSWASNSLWDIRHSSSSSPWPSILDWAPWPRSRTAAPRAPGP